MFRVGDSVISTRNTESIVDNQILTKGKTGTIVEMIMDEPWGICFYAFFNDLEKVYLVDGDDFTLYFGEDPFVVDKRSLDFKNLIIRDRNSNLI